MKYTMDTKNVAIHRYHANGETVEQISHDLRIPRSTIYHWIKQSKEQSHEVPSSPTFTLRSYHQLKAKVTRLEGIISILKSVPCTVHAPLKERLTAIEALHGAYSVHMLCEAMDVSRGTFYNHIYRNKRGDAWFVKRREELRIQIQEVYDNSNQIFGAKKIAVVLQNKGIQVSAEMVREIMQDMGLISIRQSAKALYDKDTSRYKNHVNQQFNVQEPNSVWVSDVTQFRYNNKNYYICAIIDLFARKAIGYKISHRNSTHLVKLTFQQAYASRNPEPGLIFHSDRGSNYRSNAMYEYLKKLGVIQSFSQSHVPYDNSVMESFFASMKREELYRTKYRSEREFMEAVPAYIEFYNDKRPHAKLKYKTPNQKEADYADSIEE